MSKNRVWIAVVACFVLCFANLLYAESAPTTTTNTDAMVDVLKTLESKGVLTHQEFETLKNKVTTDAQQAAQQQQAVVQQAVQQAAPQYKEAAMQEEPGQPMNVVSAMDTGVGFHTGRFDIAFSGEVNGFFIHDRPDTSHPVACDLCLISQSGNGDLTSNNSVRSGLLPSDLSVKISTQEHGWDVAVFFGIWPAIQNLNYSSVETNLGTNLGLPTGQYAGGTPGIDFRQNFATLGRPGFGTLKIGRDLGMFGQEAILNDMTLLGAGSTNGSNVAPLNVTFGRIGVGYVYTDFLPQVSYTTPTYKGLQGAIGVMQPYDDPLALIEQNIYLGAHTQPMIQGKLTYTAPLHGAVKAKFWSNFVTQKETAAVAQYNLNVGDGVRATGVDYGTKIDFHGLSLVGYGYNGWGLGTTALLFDGVGFNGAGNVDTRSSEGWYAQLGYTAHKNFFGFSYGQSNLSPLAGDAGNGALLRNNTAYIAQYRLAVTKWDNLVAEWTHATAENNARVKGDSDSVALGTIVFF